MDAVPFVVSVLFDDIICWYGYAFRINILCNRPILLLDKQLMVGIQNQHSVLIFTDAGGEGSVGFLHRFAIVGEVSKFFFRKHLKFTFVQCNSIQYRRCFWMQQMSWGTTQGRKWRRLWRNYNIRELHISDGIYMGNMQYPTKGLLEIDFFRVSKMTTGEHYSVTFKLVCVNICGANNLMQKWYLQC